MPSEQAAEPNGPEERRSLFNRLTAFETTLILGGVALFLFLLLEMQPFLNPPLIGGAMAIMLWPLRKHRAVRALLISGAFLLALWLLDSLAGVLIPFAVVYLLAFLFDPLVSFFKARYNTPRWLSSVLITVLVVGLIVLFFLLLVPNIINQLETLGTRLLASIDLLRDWVAETTLLDTLEDTGLINREQIMHQLNVVAQNQVAVITDSLPDVFQNLVQSLGSVLGALTTVLMTPVILFYILKDYPFIEERLVELFPTFGGRRDYLVEAGSLVGNYLRGLLIISTIAAFNVSVAFILLDVPFGLLLGITAGVLNLIPNLGALIANIIAVLVAFIFGDPWYIDAVTVTVVLVSQGLLEGSILTPNILSHQVGLHPVLILLALFVFGYFMGIFGFLIAVPVTALIMMVYKAYRDEWSMDISHYTTTTPPSQIKGWPITERDDEGDDASQPTPEEIDP